MRKGYRHTEAARIKMSMARLGKPSPVKGWKYKGHKKINSEIRFWDKVEKTSYCWLWKAATTKFGYGKFYYQEKMQRAHRVAWILTYGDIEKGKVACHTCDNPPCVNPSHLFIGTQLDNLKDAMNKGRYRLNSKR